MALEGYFNYASIVEAIRRDTGGLILNYILDILESQLEVLMTHFLFISMF
jgi:hypothetical protein